MTTATDTSTDRTGIYPDRWVTVSEAAEYIAYSVDTLERWRRLGTGPRYSQPSGKTGCIRYKLSDLDAFMQGGVSS